MNFVRGRRVGQWAVQFSAAPFLFTRLASLRRHGGGVGCIEAFSRAYRLRLWREYRQWRDATPRAMEADDLDEADRINRLWPRAYAIEVANGGGYPFRHINK